MTYRRKELVRGFGALEKRRFRSDKPDVFISVEYFDGYGGYNEDELLFYEILKSVGVTFGDVERMNGDKVERYLCVDNLSFRWFKRAFDKMIRDRNGDSYYGFSDAKSVFMFGILSCENCRQMLLADRMHNWFWRIVKIMEKIK